MADTFNKSLAIGLLAAAVGIGARPALAERSVFACQPEWAALAQELGGEQLSVFSAASAFQDRHRIEPRPSLVARMRDADLLVCTGAEVETGWLPILLAQSGNRRIQPGTPGYLETSRYVAKMGVPRVIDRAQGDVHPSGNPHIHLDPHNVARIAGVLSSRLTDLDPANAELYRTRFASFSERWQAAIRRWEKQGAPLRNAPLVVYEEDYSYLIRWLGMREVGTLEPGVPQAPSRLAELVERVRQDPAKAIVYSPYQNTRPVQFLSERTGIPSVMLPFTVGGTERAKDLFGLFDDLIERLLATVKLGAGD
jgi:zinc/manganese transport system substrate-binding protein